MNWFDCLEAFVAVAKHNSFNAGARALKISTPVITKRIQWLERELEASLFSRTTRRISLTETGEVLIQQINPLLSEWQDIKSELLDYKHEPQGNLSICFPPGIDAIDLFSRMIFEFSKAYPKINLQVKNTPKPIRLTDENIDVLIATDKYILEPQNTVRIKLFDYTYNLYAAPDYLNKFGIPKKPQDLTQHNCLLYAEDKIWPIEKSNYSVPSNYQGYSGLGLIKLAVLGHGIIRIPRFMILNELKHKHLKEVLPNLNNEFFQFNIFFTKRKYNSTKIKLLIEFIRNFKGINEL